MTTRDALVQIIAEVGSVHDGSFGNALRLIDLAKDCGASTVKFQTHIPEAETLRDAPMPSYFKGEPRFNYFERTAFSEVQWMSLKEHCEKVGIDFLSSPFSEEAVDLLESVGVSGYKVPSGEVTNTPLLTAIARTGKPILLSSGMSTWEELDEAVAAILEHNAPLTVMQCSSEYPCRNENVGLNVMDEMKARYGLPVGLSDHTIEPYSALAAVTLGASVIEKHLTFSRSMYGSDASHSLEPNEFRVLVQGVRAIESMLRNPVDKSDVAQYRSMKEIFQKSLVTAVDIGQGEVIAREMLGIKKPGTGLAPARIGAVVGRRARCPIPRDCLIRLEDLESPE